MVDQRNEVISCLAGALWPALPQRVTATLPAAQAACWRMTASSCSQISSEVLNVIHNCFQGSDQKQMLLLLRLLRYRLPTLLLAGHHCLQRQRPFVCSLPEMQLEAVQATLRSWAYSRIPQLRKAYKAIKAIIASAIMSHIDPATGTNPFFPAAGYTPGNQVIEKGLGAEQPVAAVEELLASATVHVPQLVAQGKDVQAYLSKRGFLTAPATHTATSTAEHSNSNSRSCPSAAVTLYYDAVVVGSGAGGGVSAALLSAAGMKVLVLEKASWVRSQDMSWLECEAHAEMYERAGFLTSHDGGVSILAGATLGGGTKINWTASLKTPDHVRQEWAAEPHMLKDLAPGAARFDEALSAVLKRLGVSTGTQMSGPNTRLLQGCHALGLHAEELPRNCLSDKCSAYCNFGCRSGHKQSSDVSWLVDAVKSGAQVLTGVEGHRLMIERQTVGDRPKRVAGLIAVSSTKSTPGARSSTLQQVTLQIHAPLVVVSCGSVHSPALLLRSGVTVGGNVGRHLRLHPAAGTVGVFAPDEEQTAAGQGAVNMYQGVSMGSFSRAAANWESSGYGAMVSVPAAHPGLLAALCPEHEPGQLKELCMQLPNISCCVIFTRDSSSGRVEVDKEGRPVIKYWPCQQTIEHMLDGISVACRALVASGAVRILVPNSLHDWQLTLNPADPLPVRQQQLEQLLTRMRQDGVPKYSMPVLSAHQMGSCRMGSIPGSSVVDPSGQCWDVSGLFVADASLFPTASGVNPMITVYGLSHMVAAGIAKRWKETNRLAKLVKNTNNEKDVQAARDQTDNV